jgi:hypothetical protein
MNFLVSTFLGKTQEAWQTFAVMQVLGSVLPKQSNLLFAFSKQFIRFD